MCERFSITHPLNFFMEMNAKFDQRSRCFDPSSTRKCVCLIVSRLLFSVLHKRNKLEILGGLQLLPVIYCSERGEQVLGLHCCMYIQESTT